MSKSKKTPTEQINMVMEQTNKHPLYGSDKQGRIDSKVNALMERFNKHPLYGSDRFRVKAKTPEDVKTEMRKKEPQAGDAAAELIELRRRQAEEDGS